MKNYQEFLQTKALIDPPTGIEVSDINPLLFEFQRDITGWALRRGRAAIFADTGMGKTLMQLEWTRHIPGRVMIVAPLCVAQQTVAEARKLGMTVKYCRDETEATEQVNICNYEMLEHFDLSNYLGIVLDESSILKSFTGKTKRLLVKSCAAVPYRLACTATPSPNDHLELGNHCEWLGIMPSNEMIMRFFINDPMEAGAYRLKEHARKPFWEWVSTWAVCVSKPSDMGYSDEGFILPQLETNFISVDVSDLPPSDGKLFRMPEMSATSLHAEGRITSDRRAVVVADIVNPSLETFVVWCNTDYEADALLKVIPDAVEVRGSQSIAIKQERIEAFSAGKIRVMITKPTVAGFGLNWQHCHNIIFMGLSYSFEQYYQAIRRCWRFGQKSEVKVHVICAESQRAILDTIFKKENRHKEMRAEMVTNIGGPKDDVRLKSDHDTEVKSQGPWTMYLGDSVTTMQEIASDSVGYTLFSPPFSNLYIYSDSAFDMGNSFDDEEFFEHFGFLIKELYRATIPGRLCSIHCKDLPLYKNRNGAAGLRDFPGRCIVEFEKHGWTFHSRVTIWKAPEIEMQRTKNHGLLYKQLCKDSAASRQGMADYIITFRKWCGEYEDPVQRDSKERFYDYIGSNPPTAQEFSYARSKDELERLMSIAVWQRYASPVWFDIRQTNVLQYRNARSVEDERHICPLQLDVIERCIELWSNPRDLVLSPFSGIGSEGYVAVKMGRRFVGIELKRSYWEQAWRNLEAANKTNEGLFEKII